MSGGSEWSHRCDGKAFHQHGIFHRISSTLQWVERSTWVRLRRDYVVSTVKLAGVHVLDKRSKHGGTKGSNTLPIWLILRVNFTLGCLPQTSERNHRAEGWPASTSFSVFTLCFTPLNLTVSVTLQRGSLQIDGLDVNISIKEACKKTFE